MVQTPRLTFCLLLSVSCENANHLSKYLIVLGYKLYKLDNLICAIIIIQPVLFWLFSLCNMEFENKLIDWWSNVQIVFRAFISIGNVFSASRDKYVRGANVIALPSASASACDTWTKTLTLAITFKPEVTRISFWTCVFLVTSPFTWYHNVWPCDRDLEVWPTFEKL